MKPIFAEFFLLHLPTFSVVSLVINISAVVKYNCKTGYKTIKIHLVWQYMCVALTVKHNYFIG